MSTNSNLVKRSLISPIHLACSSGELKKVKELIVAGADINLANRDGDTPLLVACRAGHLDVVKVLIAAGANLDAKFAYEFTKYILFNSEMSIGDINKQLFYLPREILDAVIREAEIQGKTDNDMPSKRSERREYYLKNMRLSYREEVYLWDQLPDPNGKSPGIYIYYARNVKDTSILIVHHFGPPEVIKLEDLPANNLFSIWLIESHKDNRRPNGTHHGLSLRSDVRMSILSACKHSDDEAIKSKFSSHPSWVKAIELQKLAYRMLLLPRSEQSQTLASTRWEALKHPIFGKDRTTEVPLKSLDPEYWDEYHFQGRRDHLIWVTKDEGDFYYEMLNESTGKDISYDGKTGCFTVHISDGLLLRPSNDGLTLQPINSSRVINGPSFFQLINIADDESIFVLNKDNQLIISDPQGNVQSLRSIHHSSLAKGEPVICAGTLKIIDGKVDEITFDSGHYGPSEKCLFRFIEFLEENKVDLSKTKVTLDHDRMYDREFMSVQEFKELMEENSGIPLRMWVMPSKGHS